MKNRSFKISYPHIGFKTIEYVWPDPDRYPDRFFHKRADIVDDLLERTKRYARELEINLSDYPHATLGRKGICIGIGSGGEWIEIGDIAGTFMVATHNSSGYPLMLAFNLASATLELIDDFEAPLISREDEKYAIQYPLPEGHDKLPIDEHPHIMEKEMLQVWFSSVDLGYVVEVDEQNQVVIGEKAILQVQDNTFEGIDLDGHDVHKASYVMSTMMNSFIFD